VIVVSNPFALTVEIIYRLRYLVGQKTIVVLWWLMIGFRLKAVFSIKAEQNGT